MPFFAYNPSYNFTRFLRAFYTRFYNFTHVPNTLNTRIFYLKLRQLATASPAPLGRISSQAAQDREFRKTIKGKDYYFGRREDPAGALSALQSPLDDLRL